MRHRHAFLFALLVLSGSWLALGNHPARADASEPAGNPALDACQRLATSHYQKVSPAQFVAVQFSEEGVSSAKYDDKVGSQPVATVLNGRGVWQEKAGGSSDVHFTCLLESADKPIFVDVAKEGPRDPVDACWDGFQPAGWEEMTRCLQNALKRTEATLGEALRKAAQQAEQSLDKISAKQTLKDSDAQWVKYRDSECDRQQASVAGRNHPDIGELTCKIRQTAQRIADLNFDED